MLSARSYRGSSLTCRAATVSLSHMMAYEFARRNLEIRVNVIAPGYFPSVCLPASSGLHITDGQGMTVIPKESNDVSDSAYRDFRNNWAIPFGRPGSAADHAQAILSVATVSAVLCELMAEPIHDWCRDSCRRWLDA